MSELGHQYSDTAGREAALRLDRERAAAPLPGHGQSHYTSEGQRQSALYHAEQSNIATAAGELGLTSDEWQALRTKLGRQPSVRDIQQ